MEAEGLTHLSQSSVSQGVEPMLGRLNRMDIYLATVSFAQLHGASTPDLFHVRARGYVWEMPDWACLKHVETKTLCKHVIKH